MSVATKKMSAKKTVDSVNKKIEVDALEGYFLSLALDEMPSEAQEQAYGSSKLTYMQAKREVQRVASVLQEQQVCGSQEDRDALAKELADHQQLQKQRNAEIEAIIAPLLAEQRQMQVESERLLSITTRQQKAIDRLRRRYPAEIHRRIETVQRLAQGRGLHQKLGAAKQWVDRLQDAIDAQPGDLYQSEVITSVDRGIESRSQAPLPIAFGLADTAQKLGMIPANRGPGRKPLPVSLLSELRERARQELPTALAELESVQELCDQSQQEIHRLESFYVPM